jgi:hypothetical protein
MPQLDIDLFDDFIFFAFVSLLFGIEDEGEENVIAMGTDLFLAQYYLQTKKVLIENRNYVKNLFVFSILKRK